jgi:hypothetical protein
MKFPIVDLSDGYALAERIRDRIREEQKQADTNQADADSGWCLLPESLRTAAAIHQHAANVLREVLGEEASS